eukprot:TRINITY_DN18958_c0_g2_i2.p2 TRINITY_DN18958_c0_g2~~TRINITY_DN18958_c0_g2_i2.p2  ORF type:complete len:106 (-),score=29.43 TRINITY_DN18958_c0_g2_i2:10-327(-)
MIRRPPRSTQGVSSAASDVYKRQVLDIAHGHSKYAGKTVEFIKTNYPEIDVVAGNIATKDAAEYFLSKGADAIKVGIGPGSMCTCLLYTSPSPRDLSTSRMPSSA